MLSGLAGVIGTRLLVDNFRNSAVGVEREATTNAQVRAEVVAHSILVASPITDTQQRQLGAIQTTIRADFARAITGENTPRAKQVLQKSFAKWQAIVAAAGPPGHPADLVTRGAAVTTGAPKVLALLDRAGRPTATLCGSTWRMPPAPNETRWWPLPCSSCWPSRWRCAWPGACPPRCSDPWASCATPPTTWPAASSTTASWSTGPTSSASWPSASTPWPTPSPAASAA